MKKIGELIARDLSKEIEEIIKLDQADEATVYSELTEYIATRSLREGYEKILRAISTYRNDPHEGTGIWISGFFGSGKSSFAKNLGYALGNLSVLGHRASELLKTQLGDDAASTLLDSVNAQVPFEVVMFDVQTDKSSAGTGSASLSWFMYRALLKALDYAEDVDIADLEQTLEADGKLKAFIDKFESHHRAELEKDPAANAEQLRKGRWRWSLRRKLAGKMNEASHALHLLDRNLYPSADSWAMSHRPVDVTPALLVDKSYELVARRRPGKALLFVVDEVGAYVSRSKDKIEDLRVVLEQFGKAGKNRFKAKEVVAPVWVVVTSQEKLDDVVAAIDSKRVELARLQDRFKYPIDLKAHDIREVATKRVLAKRPEARPLLSALFREFDGALNQMLAFERSQRKTDVREADFVDFYPYPPHFLDLCIEIMAGIRLQPGAPRHLGGSNRTIIKQTFEMLRTRMRDAPIRRLVTLDVVYDLVQANLASEKQKDISDIAVQFGDASWEVRVAKALCLLEFVRDVVRTPVNVAAVLCDQVDAPQPLPQVQEALGRLSAAHFVRQGSEGYKLQTNAEKTWDGKRRALDPKPRDRRELVDEVLKGIFEEPRLRAFTYSKLRTFKLNVTSDGAKLVDGQLPLQLVQAESPAALARTLDDTIVQSRQKAHEDEAFWVYSLTPEIDEHVAELFRSRQMIAEYRKLDAQQKTTQDEKTCLGNEENESSRILKLLRQVLVASLQEGTGAFRGAKQELSSQGKPLADVLRDYLEKVVPKLYEHLEMGSIPLKGGEAEELLKAANLSGLSQVVYEQGLALVKREDGRYVIRIDAPTADQVLSFLREKAKYGEKVDGKDLEKRFTGLKYGWDLEVVRLVLAALLRAGAIEMTHQDRRYRGHQDEACRIPFTNLPAFRAAGFSPRETVSRQLLASAADNLEGITGQEVNVEETEIAKAFAKLAEDEEAVLLPVFARAEAQRLPEAEELQRHLAQLRAVRSGPSDDCVRFLANEGKSLRDALQRVRGIRKVLTPENLEALREAQATARELSPLVTDPPAAVQAARELGEILAGPSALSSLPRIRDLAGVVSSAYSNDYEVRHEERRALLESAAERLKGRREWLELAQADKEPFDLLQELGRRGIHDVARTGSQPVCSECRATVAQMTAEIAGIPLLEAELVKRLVELAEPKAHIERVRARDFFGETLETPADVDAFVEQLRSHLHKLVDGGARVLVE